MTEGELELIKARGAGVSHCAGSNFNLRSGVARVGEWLVREAGEEVEVEKEDAKAKAHEREREEERDRDRASEKTQSSKDSAKSAASQDARPAVIRCVRASP